MSLPLLTADDLRRIGTQAQAAARPTVTAIRWYMWLLIPIAVVHALGMPRPTT